MSDNIVITKYLYKLTGISLSTILYVRNFFDENSYASINFGPLQLRVLKRGTNDHVNGLIKFMKNFFKPLECHYLKTLIMEIHDSFDLIECYKIDYDYDSVKYDEIIKFPTKNNIDFMLNLLHSMDKMKSMRKNQHYHVVFKLAYNPTTPTDYEPNGFESFKSDTVNQNLQIIDNIEIEDNCFSIQIEKNFLQNEDDDDGNQTELHSSNLRSRKLFNS